MKTAWANHLLSSVSVLAFLCCFVLTIVPIANDSHQKEGLLIVKFNLTELAPFDSISLPGVGERDIFDAAESLGASLKTMLPAAVTRVQSVVDAVATAVPGHIDQVQEQIEDQIADLIPTNCSLGTQKFCIGYAGGTSCSGLPPRLSDLLPPTLANAVPVFLNTTHMIDKAFAATTSARIIQAPLVVGLLLLIVPITGLGLYTLGEYSQICCPPENRKTWMTAALWLLGLGVLTLLIVPLVLMGVMQSKLAELPGWVSVQAGRANDVFVGSVICAAISLATNRCLWGGFSRPLKSGSP